MSHLLSRAGGNIIGKTAYMKKHSRAKERDLKPKTNAMTNPHMGWIQKAPTLYKWFPAPAFTDGRDAAIII